MAMKLLTEGNAKTSLGESYGYLTGILYLNPRTNRAKLCPYASESCFTNCLVDSGLGQVYPKINAARARKTMEFLSNRQAFIDTLRQDIKALIRRAKRLNLIPAIRLNGTSDILWEKLSSLMVEFSEVQFYDYTKVPLQHRGQLPNYHLTFSFSGDNWQACEDAMNRGVNVAVVFAGDIPDSYKGHEVIDGTEHDLRFLDKKNVIVGLCIKGNEAKKRAKQNSDFLVTL